LSKTSGDIKENNYYKQQLINTLNPVKFNKKDVKWLNYHKDDLSELISKYNNQFNNGTAERNSVKKTKVFYKKNKRQFINITPHIGFNNSELIIDYAVVNRELNFGRKSSIIYGLEVEGIIPYFKKKFSFLFDASFQSHKISGTYLPPNTPFEREISGNYKAIDLGIGLRYRLLLKNKSLLYTNFIMYSTLKHTDKVSFSRGGSIDFHEQNIYYGSISLGYKFKNKYSVEVKTSTKRNINEFSERSKIKYLNHAIVFGYTIF
jgi:hypothetical protein